MPTIDAINCDQQYPASHDETSKLIARNREFGPLLGATRVHSRHVPGGRVLVTAEAAGVGEYHPRGPLTGQPRYDWQDRGDGVQYGVLRPADAEGPTPEQISAELIAKRKAGMEADIAKLAAIPADRRTKDQAANLTKLNDWYARLYPAAAVDATPEAPTTHE